MVRPEEVQERAQAAMGHLTQLQFRREFNKEYTTNEDFGKMLPESRRLVIVGCTGAGKSALVNKLAGFRMEFDEQKASYEWTVGQELLPFLSQSSTKSVTRFTSFANLHYLGYAPDKPFICVDTPGHDDTDPGLLTEQATDLHVKLQAMQYVNSVLVLHKDFEANRLDPATFELLRKVSTLFQKSGMNVWEHVILGYTRVDEEKRGWRSGIDQKIAAMQAALKEKTKGFDAPCTVDVPVVCLSCYDTADDDPRPVGGVPWPNEFPNGRRIAQRDGFVELWEFLQRSSKLPTEELQVYEGVEERYRRACEDRDAFARISSARKHFMSTAMHVLIFLFILLLRPGVFNMEGWLDELTGLGGFVYVMGFHAVLDFTRVCWDDHCIPRLRQIPQIAEAVDLDQWRALPTIEDPTLKRQKSK